MEGFRKEIKNGEGASGGRGGGGVGGIGTCQPAM